MYGVPFDVAQFTARLWGDVYFHAKTREFVKKPTSATQQRTFVELGLEPLYKIFSQTVGDVDSTLDLGVRLSTTELKVNILQLLRLVCTRLSATSPVS
jgi:U5 small nuclear ribonucleoprotein component